MGENPLWRRQTGGHQKGWPIDRMKAQNILADHVHIRRPVGLETFCFRIGIADGGDIICQGIDPDVHDVGIVARYRHTPLERSSGNG